jgi:hypothetical protein
MRKKGQKKKSSFSISSFSLVKKQKRKKNSYHRTKKNNFSNFTSFCAHIEKKKEERNFCFRIIDGKKYKMGKNKNDNFCFRRRCIEKLPTHYFTLRVDLGAKIVRCRFRKTVKKKRMDYWNEFFFWLAPSKSIHSSHSRIFVKENLFCFFSIERQVWKNYKFFG